MTRRRGNGEGGIYFESSRNRWVGQIDLSDGLGGRQRRKVTGRTKTEVATRIRAIRAQDIQVRRSGAVATVAQLLERWLSTAAAARFGETSSTYLGYKHQTEIHLVPALGSIRLERLHPEQIDDYLAAKARDGYSRSTIVKHRSILGQALRWGVKRRHLSWDPASLAEIPPASVFAAAQPKQSRTPRALTASEARQFVERSRSHRNGAALVLALTTGLRPGELLALTWDDVDLEAGVLHITRAWKGTKANRHLGDPKTKGSVRSIGLAAPMVDILRNHRHKQGSLRVGEPRGTEPLVEFVFTSRSGHPIDPANLRSLCRAVATGAGLGHLSPYDLRHSATSLLSEAGVRNEELADLLGHVDTRMVERHYRHRLSESVTVAVGPMGKLLSRTDDERDQ